MRGGSYTRALATWALLLTIASPVYGATPAGCAVLDPELQGTYTGDCVDGLAHGSGEAVGTFAQYQGGFSHGRKQGRGIKTWATSADRYEGDFVDDRKHGRGTYTWGSRSAWAGERYVGEYHEDLRHGQGEYHWPNGDRYAGPWEADRPIGPPTPRMFARARAQGEVAAAVRRPGVRVCREMTVGIGTRDRVRGTVTQVEPGHLTIRIDDPGRFQHVIAASEIKKGDVVRDSVQLWTPCL